MPLFWLSLAFLAGILLASLLTLPFYTWLLIAVLTLSPLFVVPLFRRIAVQSAGLFGFTRRYIPSLLFRVWNRISDLFSCLKLPVPLALLLGVFMLGAFRYQATRPVLSDPAFIAWHNDTPSDVIVEGVLVKPPDERDLYTHLHIQASQIRLVEAHQNPQVHGLLLARVAPGGGWRYGDRISLRGSLVTPPEYEEFSYRDYLAHQGVYSYMAYPEINLLARDQGNPVLASIYEFKARAIETAYRLFPDPEASLLAGILLGDESGIPSAVRESFNDTGTAHIIAISGFNITVLAALFTWIFGRMLGRWRGALIATILIAIYTILVGASASVVRAALMGWVRLNS